MKRFVALVFAIICLAACQKAPELTLTGLTNVEISPDGGSANITFITNRDWAVSWSESWINVSPSSGSGSKSPITLSVSCGANTIFDDRSGVVTIKAEDLIQTVTVKQLAKLGLVVPTQTFNLQSGAKTIEVEVQSNVQYTVDIADSWIKQTGTKGLTSNKLIFSIEANTTYDAREGTITIKPSTAASGIQDQIICVKQAQNDALIINDTNYDMPYGGGQIEVKVEANVDLSVKPSVDWIHHVETKGLSSSTILLSVDDNPSFDARNGRVDIIQNNGTLSRSLVVKQAGRTAVSSIELNKTSLVLVEGKSEILIASVKPDNAVNKSITWSSSDNTVASVDSKGKVTAKSKGTATIKATANDGSGKYATCLVTVTKQVSSISLDKTAISIYTNKSETITATVTPPDASNKAISWSSSDSSIATVSSDGIVTGKSHGKAIITACATDGSEVQATCSVEVKQYVTDITLNKTSTMIYVGNMETLTASIGPNDADDKTITWTCLTTDIVSVSNTGIVTALAPGYAEVIATANDGSGVYASCAIEIPPYVDLGLSVKWAACNLGKTGFVNKPEDYGEYYAWGETSPKKDYSWSSYKWCGGSYNTLTKYNSDSSYGIVDSKTEFKDYNYVDDVAREKLGNKWHIPTHGEWTELWDNCTFSWGARNGVLGMTLKSKKNGNSIFFPAAGYKKPNLQDPGQRGRYWSSSCETQFYHSQLAFCFLIGTNMWGDQTMDRPYGCSVRPVTK